MHRYEVGKNGCSKINILKKTERFDFDSLFKVLRENVSTTESKGK